MVVRRREPPRELRQLGEAPVLQPVRRLVADLVVRQSVPNGKEPRLHAGFPHVRHYLPPPAQKPPVHLVARPPVKRVEVV